jgi:hypothetical protein
MVHRTGGQVGLILAEAEDGHLLLVDFLAAAAHLAAVAHLEAGKYKIKKLHILTCSFLF